MASSSLTNPAYNVPAFHGRDHLVALHQEITDFLHYQSHVRFAATKSLPPHTTAANERERETIIEFLKERLEFRSIVIGGVEESFEHPNAGVLFFEKLDNRFSFSLVGGGGVRR